MKAPFFTKSLFLLVLVFACSLMFGQSNCNCEGFVLIQANPDCRYILSKEAIGAKNCTDAYIVVADAKPGNRDTIDASGTFDYSLLGKDGNVICKGLVNAQAAPFVELDSVDFFQDTLPYTDLNTLSDKTYGATNSNNSPRSNQIFLGADGKYQSWDFVGGKYQAFEFQNDGVPNLGIAYFKRKCIADACPIIISIVPDFKYPNCDEVLKNDLFVTLIRKWNAYDCNQTFGKQVVQEIPIKRPKVEDFHWNVPILNSRAVALNYGDCTLDPKKIPLDALFPVLGKTNQVLGRSDSPYPNITLKTKDQVDTLCNGEGLQYQRRYVLYDECYKKNIDSFTVNLKPGNSTSNWISSSAEKKVLPIPKDSCHIPFYQNLDSILKVLDLKLNPVCKIAHLDWKLEQFSENLFQTFGIETWLEIKGERIFYGRFRIHFTMVDECQNLCTKTFEFKVSSKEELKVICIQPFRAALSNNYFYASYRFARAEPARQPCGSVAHVRRIVSKECLAPHLYNTYDIDRDFNIIEHFELIKSGPHAGKYYTPWSYYVEAFACDRGKVVDFEARVSAFDGRETICSSFFYVGDQNPYQAKIEVAKVTTSLKKQVKVPVNISPFLNIIGMQFGLKFDPTLLKFDSVHFPSPILKKALTNPPGGGSNTKDRVLLSWSYDGRNAVSLSNQSPVAEFYFSPLKAGTSKIWIDTTFLTEIIDLDNIEYAIRTSVGEVQVLSKEDLINRAKESFHQPASPTNQSSRTHPGILIFPNPTIDMVNVTLPQDWPPQGHISIRDTQGKLLLQQNIDALTTSIDVQNISSGIVLIEVRHNEQVWVNRLVLIRP